MWPRGYHNHHTGCHINSIMNFLVAAYGVREANGAIFNSEDKIANRFYDLFTRRANDPMNVELAKQLENFVKTDILCVNDMTRHQDCGEILSKLLTLLNDYGKELFYMTTVRIMECDVCGESSRETEFCSAILDVAEYAAQGEDDLLQAHRKTEAEFMKEIRCKSCGVRYASHYYDFIPNGHPPILIFRLNQDKSSGRAPAFKVPEELELYDGGRYVIRSVISHLGSSNDQGHFIAQIRTDDGQWTTCNDASVSRGSAPNPKDAFLLLFERVKQRYSADTSKTIARNRRTFRDAVLGGGQSSSKITSQPNCTTERVVPTMKASTASDVRASVNRQEIAKTEPKTAKKLAEIGRNGPELGKDVLKLDAKKGEIESMQAAKVQPSGLQERQDGTLAKTKDAARNTYGLRSKIKEPDLENAKQDLPQSDMTSNSSKSCSVDQKVVQQGSEKSISDAVLLQQSDAQKVTKANTAGSVQEASKPRNDELRTAKKRVPKSRTGPPSDKASSDAISLIDDDDDRNKNAQVFCSNDLHPHRWPDSRTCVVHGSICRKSKIECKLCMAEVDEGDPYYQCANSEHNIRACRRCVTALASVQCSLNNVNLTLGHYVSACHLDKWWTTTEVTLAVSSLFLLQPELNRARHLVRIDIGAVELPLLRGTKASEIFKTGKRFALVPVWCNSHYFALLLGRESINDSKVTRAWRFDSFNEQFSKEEREMLKGKGCTGFVKIRCPEQKDAHNCGPLTLQNCANILRILANDDLSLGSIPLVQLDEILREGFEEIQSEPALAREYLLQLMERVPAFGHCIDSLKASKRGEKLAALGDFVLAVKRFALPFSWYFSKKTKTKQAGGANLAEMQPEGRKDFNDDLLMQVVQPTHSAEPANNAISGGQIMAKLNEIHCLLSDTVSKSEAADPGNENSDSESVCSNYRSSPPAKPYVAPISSSDITWPPFRKAPSGYTSTDCFYILCSTVDSIPAENYESFVNRILRDYGDWVRKLDEKDQRNFMLRATESLDRKLGSLAGWTIKSRQENGDLPWGFTYYLACNRRGQPKGKVPGGEAGKAERGKVNNQVGCKRAATIGMTLTFRHKHEDICASGISRKGESIPRQNLFSNAEDEELLAEVGSVAQLKNDHGLLRLVVLRRRPELSNQEINSLIFKARSRYLSKAHDNKDVQKFIQSLQDLRFRDWQYEGISNDSGGLSFLARAAWIHEDWKHPRQFVAFLIDGVAKVMCRDYHLILVLGLDQHLRASIVAVGISTEESAAGVSLVLQVMEQRDPSLKTRQTLWMSDESTGIRNALKSRPGRIVHRVCNLHKAANLFTRMEVKGKKGGDRESERARMAKVKMLREEASQLKSILQEKGLGYSSAGRQDFSEHEFSKWSDCYPKPKRADDNANAGLWLNFLRTSPSIEHLLIRLFEEFATTSERQIYSLWMWETRDRWTLCCQSPFPDLGLGTNNLTEATIRLLRADINKQSDLFEFFTKFNNFAKRHHLSIRKTQDGKAFDTLNRLEEDVRNFDCLRRHLQKANVTRHGRVRILTNCNNARGFQVEVVSNGLDEEARLELASHSAFALRFLVYLDHVSQSSHSVLLKISVARRSLRQAMNSRVFSGMEHSYVLILKQGSYVCSCGYTIQYAGLPCPHICACYEHGFMYFHAHRHLHPFWIEAPGENLDLSRIPEYMTNKSVDGCCHPSSMGKVLIPISNGTIWNPFLPDPVCDGRIDPMSGLRIADQHQEVSLRRIFPHLFPAQIGEVKADAPTDNCSHGNEFATVSIGQTVGASDGAEEAEEIGDSQAVSQIIHGEPAADLTASPPCSPEVTHGETETSTAHDKAIEDVELSPSSADRTLTAADIKTSSNSDPLDAFSRARNHLLDIKKDARSVTLFCDRLTRCYPEILGEIEQPDTWNFKVAKSLLEKCEMIDSNEFDDTFVGPLLREHLQLKLAKNAGKETAEVAALPKQKQRRKGHSQSSPVSRFSAKRAKAKDDRKKRFASQEDAPGSASGDPSSAASGQTGIEASSAETPSSRKRRSVRDRQPKRKRKMEVESPNGMVGL